MFRKAYFVSLAALVLVAAAPAPSAALASNGAQQQNVTSGQSGGSDSTAKSERKICKILPDTARRTATKRLCLTRAEWREFNEAMEN